MSHPKTEKPVTGVDQLSLHDENYGAAFLDVKPRTMQAWRVRGEGPQFVKVGRAVRYRLCDLIAWSEQRIRSSTSS